MFTSLKLSRSLDGLVETLTLNRPNQLNAVSSLLLNELVSYFGSLIDIDKGIATSVNNKVQPRVIILRGEGKGFCAGLDLADTGGFAHADPYISLSAQHRLSELIIRMRRCPQPIIAVLQGATCGAGLALALASDVRVATSDLKAQVAMATIGLSSCDMGISYHLPRAIGAGPAALYMMTGRFMLANDAEKLGFAKSIHSTYEQALEDANKVASDMVTLNPMGLALTKQGLNASWSASSLESQIHIEDRQQVLIATLPDFHSRAQKFLSNKKKSKI